MSTYLDNRAPPKVVAVSLKIDGGGHEHDTQLRPLHERGPALHARSCARGLCLWTHTAADWYAALASARA